MNGPLLLGIDIGTTRTKTGVVGLDGEELLTVSAPTVWEPVATGAETTTAALLASVRQAVAGLLAELPADAGEIIGVGITGMAESMILLDAGGIPVEPVVAWHDRRAVAEFAGMNAIFGRADIGGRTGLGVVQLPSAPTLRWLTANIDGARRCRHALSVAEWVVRTLGGDTAAEASLASRTGVLDLETRQWWPEMAAWTGIPPSAFPEVRTAGTSWGRVRRTAGLERLEGAVLTVAGHDHPCASVGIGVTSAAQVMDSCGTAEALMRPVAAGPDQDPAAGLGDDIATGWHVLADHYLLLGGRHLGLDLMGVLRELSAETRHGHTDLDAAALALGDNPTSGGRAVSPAGRWRDAALRHTEGATALLRGLIRLGGPVSEVRLSGGWAANPVLRHLKADSFPNPVYPHVREAGVRGAALLVGQAVGVYPSPTDFPPPRLDDARASTATHPAF